MKQTVTWIGLLTVAMALLTGAGAAEAADTLIVALGSSSTAGKGVEA